MKQATIQQPLLSNGSKHKHVSTAMRTQAIMGEMFSMQFASKCYNRDPLVVEVSLRTAAVQLL
jgi:hypothetical protein